MENYALIKMLYVECYRPDVRFNFAHLDLMYKMNSKKKCNENGKYLKKSQFSRFYLHNID